MDHFSDSESSDSESSESGTSESNSSDSEDSEREEKPIKRLERSVQNNPIALRYFIQYEILQTKSILKSFETFEAVVGYQVELDEFKFWYLRFCKGMLEMDYDQIQDKEPLTIWDLPVDMAKVVKLLKKSVSDNPPALGYFIHQQILQDKAVSLETCWKSFCETIGNDVMEFEEFDCYFNEFRKGEFDNRKCRKLPVDMIKITAPLKKSIENNPIALRFFIQYEVLQKKPIFKSYKRFCETIGDDVMDYPEFEFWYMRFYNGMDDVDYDRSNDKEPLTFSKLPLEILDLIVKKLGTFDRLMTRQVSKSLQTTVDRQKPLIDTISFNIDSDKSMSLFLLDEYMYIFYKKSENGCEISHKRDGSRKKIFYEIKGADPLVMAFNHLNLLMSNPAAPLENLSIYYHENEENLRKIEKITEKYISKFIVKELQSQQFSKHYSCCGVQRERPKDEPLPEQIFPSILKTMKPVTLEVMDFSNGEDKLLGSTATTEQFLNAKKISTGCLLPEEIPHLYHLTEFYVYLDTIPKKVLVDLKNEIEKSTTFKRCRLYSENIPSVEEIEEVFGPPLNQKGITVRRRIIPEEERPNSYYDYENFIRFKREF